MISHVKRVMSKNKDLVHKLQMDTLDTTTSHACQDAAICNYEATS